MPRAFSITFSPPLSPARRGLPHEIPVLKPLSEVHAGLPGEKRQIEAGPIESVDGGNALQNVQDGLRGDPAAHQLRRRPVAGKIHGDANDSGVRATTDETGGLDVQVGVQRGGQCRK